MWIMQLHIVFINISIDILHRLPIGCRKFSRVKFDLTAVESSKYLKSFKPKTTQIS